MGKYELRYTVIRNSLGSLMLSSPIKILTLIDPFHNLSLISINSLLDCIDILFLCRGAAGLCKYAFKADATLA